MGVILYKSHFVGIPFECAKSKNKNKLTKHLKELQTMPANSISFFGFAAAVAIIKALGQLSFISL